MAKYQYNQITVLLPKKVFEQVLKLAKSKFRNNKTAAAAYLIEEGLKSESLL